MFDGMFDGTYTARNGNKVDCDVEDRNEVDGDVEDGNEVDCDVEDRNEVDDDVEDDIIISKRIRGIQVLIVSNPNVEISYKGCLAVACRAPNNSKFVAKGSKLVEVNS